MSTVLKTANRIAGSIYKQFMQQVIEKHVINDRREERIYKRLHKPTISDNKNTKPKKKTSNETDIRTLYLLSISGKGGWTNNLKKRESYLKNANITLLDHLLSVTRGALMLAAIDLIQQDENIDLNFLKQRLKMIVCIAFLHDLDKMEQLKRDQALSIDLVEQALVAYGLYDFLNKDLEETITLDAEQIRFLIEHAEDSQSHRHRPKILPAFYYQNDIKNYVKLADKLDGIWQQHGANAGLKYLIKRLENEQSLQSNVLTQWQALELFDPHHPFLLDELQKELSYVCKRKANIPPLIETHQDGYLFMLLPIANVEVIKNKALQYFRNRLPFSLYLNISTVGVPELINEQPTYKRYKTFVGGLSSRNLSRIFLVKRFLIKDITVYMDECLADIGLKPQWPKIIGQTIVPYPNPDELYPTALSYLNKAAMLALLLNLKTRANKKAPNYIQREIQLCEKIKLLVQQDIPKWIQTIEKKADQSRRTLLALWTTALIIKFPRLEEAIWGDEGLLKLWLEGNDTQMGLRALIEDNTHIAQSVEQHFKQLITSEYQQSIPITAKTGHCIFTNTPTNTLIAAKMNLYGVKVSAFAGREGRSETVAASPKGSVHISNISIAEYKLREKSFKLQGGKKSGVPTLISSPVTTGLFSALILNDESSLQGLSIYDLARKKVTKDKVTYRGLEIYNRRYRMARFELMPNKLIDQINTLRLLLSACLRIGRPIHVFRGLPTYQKAFFYYDAMPSVLKQLIGFNQLRIEQIPTAIKQLRIADELINEHGLGYDIFTLYANINTRFQAACLAYCHLRDRGNGSLYLNQNLLTYYLNTTKEKTMNEQDGALVRLGQMAARIQRSPIGKTSTSEETLVFNITLDTALGLCAIQQVDQESLIYGIAGELETNLVRKDKMSAKKHRDENSLYEECINFSTYFVKYIWKPILKQRLPSQTSRRLLCSIYRMAFLEASRNKCKNKKREINT